MNCEAHPASSSNQLPGFDPVTAGSKYLNGLNEQDLDYDQRVIRFLVDEALSSAQIKDWIQAALKQRMSNLIDDNRVAEHQLKYVELCRARYGHGIPSDEAAVQAAQLQWHLDYTFVKQNLPSGLVDNKGEVSESSLRRLLPGPIVREWPIDSQGHLVLDVDTIGRIDNEITKLIYDYKRLIKTQAITRFTVDDDGRHRSWSNPFGTITGRDKPRGNSFMYLPKSYRCLIKPNEGYVIVLIDYQQQEPAILATLSNDQLMKNAYQGGDLYQLLGAEPEFHGLTRKQLKRLLISFIYGISAYGLSRGYQITLQLADIWLKKLEVLFASSMQWLNAYAERAYSAGRVSCLDWAMWVTASTPLLTIRNWPVQATGADILRRACFNLANRNLQVVGCLHDAVLINIPINNHQNTIREAELAMQDASEEVLGTLRLKTAVEAMYWPDVALTIRRCNYGR